MGALLYNLSCVHDQNLMGTLDGCQTVGNDYGGSAFSILSVAFWIISSE